jgi:hypothetical protein
MTPEFTDTDLALLQQVSASPLFKSLPELDDASLCRISRAEDVDFATALLYRAIRTSAEHGPFVDRMEELLHEDSANHRRLDAVFVVAPGAFYREHPETGADGKTLCGMAAAMGCPTHVISTESLGSAAENGRIICDWLLGEGGRNIVLCSLSKGGADVKMALAERNAPEAFRNVVAWLNVGGITAGSPMATWLVERPLLARLYQAIFWWRGQDFRFIRELVRRVGSPLDFEVSLPRHVRAIHVLGFPLARHVRTRPTRRSHRRLSCYGPNDGATILVDSCKLPGLILPVWGADHYLDARHSPERLLRALLHYVGDELNLFARPAVSNSFAGSVAST